MFRVDQSGKLAGKFLLPCVLIFTLWLVTGARSLHEEELLQLDNGVIKIGIDRGKGASLTCLSWRGYPGNSINSHDPGRLIQQSYYAGKSVDRTAEGQHKAWSPWTWNPIQGGGVASWARVVAFQKEKGEVLFAETVPKLWDMPDEEAEAVMRQWTGIEAGMPNVAVVECEFLSKRKPNDQWGEAVARHQELPACYFTRNFSRFASYLGGGEWREESQQSGPPWGHADPPKKAMACFNEEGQGVAVFSPASDGRWNFGPHGAGDTSDPVGGPCVHVAPIATVKLGPQSTLRYRYWLVAGTENEIAVRLDALWRKYSDERLTLTSL